MTFQLDTQFTNFCKAHCPLINFKGIPFNNGNAPYGKGMFDVNFPSNSYLTGLQARRNAQAFWVRPYRPCSAHASPVVGLGRISEFASPLRTMLPMVKTLIATSGQQQYVWVVLDSAVSRRGMTRAFFWLRQLLRLPNLIPEGTLTYKDLEAIAMSWQWMPLPNSISAAGATVSCSYVGKVPTRLPDPFEMVSRLEEINPAVVPALLTKKEQIEFVPNQWGHNAKKVREMAFWAACYHLKVSPGNRSLAIRETTSRLTSDCEKYSSNPILADRTARHIVAAVIRTHPHLG